MKKVQLLLIAIVILAIVSGCSNSDDSSKSSTTESSAKREKSSAGTFVEWSFNGNNWQEMGEAPDCEDPISIESPMDVSLATDILYPGQVRGGDYKPHGGLGIDGASNNEIEVKAVRDSYLYRGARYIEQGEIQYLFDFMDSCGVMYRLDHLAKLSPEFEKYANLLPEAKVDDSRTTKFTENPLIKAGTKVATQVGFVKNNNAFFDFGLYDLRQPNDASKTAIFETEQGRIQDKEQSFFALCWLDNLPEDDQTKVKSLPARGQEGKTSDYCSGVN